jgi:hypothetical protein
MCVAYSFVGIVHFATIILASCEMSLAVPHTENIRMNLGARAPIFSNIGRNAI